MLNLQGYGIELKSLTEETAELLRQWRNEPIIAEVMEYRTYISKEDQRKWFQSIQNEQHHYFTIHLKEDCIGMIHLSKIDSENRTADSGLLIGNSKYRGTGIALKASLLLLDFAFEILKLEIVFAKVSQTNSIAQDYNKALGFIFDKQLTNGFQQWKVVPGEFTGKKEFLLKLFSLKGW